MGLEALFTGVCSRTGLFLFFAFSSLRAFNEGKTRVKPEELDLTRLAKGSTSLILRLTPHKHVSDANHSRKGTKLYIQEAMVQRPTVVEGESDQTLTLC